MREVLCAVVLLASCSSCNPGPSVALVVPSGPATSPYGAPVWTADGKCLLFMHAPLKAIARDSDGNWQQQFYWDSAGVWAANVDGSDQRLLRQLTGSLGISRDGRWVAIGTPGNEIQKVQVSGDSLALSTMVSVGEGGLPSWSPDGTRILVQRGSGLWVLSADGSSERLVEGTSGARYPDWHPAGERALACNWLHSTADTAGIIEYDLSGVRAPRLVRLGFAGDPTCQSCRRFYSPHYSPDGKQIAWISQDAYTGGNIEVWIMNGDGTRARPLTGEGVLPDGMSWSPDGRKIAYVSYRSWDFTLSNGTIWIVDVQTAVKSQVTFNRL